jgi:methylmalonyl-CoA mutase N-terminal domain/subunit
LDETLALPTDESAEIALRTQQVIMEESGVANVSDPLGGSWYVEALTDRIEAEAEAIFARILAMAGDREHPIGPMTSGILRGIEDGWFMAEIAESAFTYQQALEKGTKKVVGVNVHTSTNARELEILRISHEVEHEQRAELARRRADRDAAAVRAALDELVAVARSTQNLVPAILNAARAEASLGEICGALRGLWGGYREPARF